MGARTNPVILGRKNCSRCGRWRHISDFPCQRREPFKLQSQCQACAREVSREWHKRNPGKRKAYTERWRAQHLEEDRRKRREYARKRRSDPNSKAVVRKQAAENWRRMREDPERWAKRLALQREQYAKRKEDPEWVERAKAKRLERYHEHGGREEAQAKRAREKLRKQFAQTVAACLRVELERREAEAKAKRAKRQAWLKAWVADRRRRWEAGEFDDLPPVYVNGREGVELQRLPAKPLADWIKDQYGTVEALAREVEMLPRSLSRYTNGEAVTVRIEVVDEITTRTETLLLDIYDPATYPDLYEPPPTNGNGLPRLTGPA